MAGAGWWLRLLGLCASASCLRRRSSSVALEDRVRPLEGSCYAFVEAGEYWGYEWCHRRWVKQFQAGWAVSAGSKRQETTLGTFSSSLSGARGRYASRQHAR